MTISSASGWNPSPTRAYFLLQAIFWKLNRPFVRDFHGGQDRPWGSTNGPSAGAPHTTEIHDSMDGRVFFAMARSQLVGPRFRSRVERPAGHLLLLVPGLSRPGEVPAEARRGIHPGVHGPLPNRNRRVELETPRRRSASGNASGVNETDEPNTTPVSPQRCNPTGYQLLRVQRNSFEHRITTP